jgi:ubiquinone/menaquinone biosynthesis C-methylase UbiE
VSTGDIFRFINTLDDVVVDRIAGRLEFRERIDTFVRLRDAYFARLPLAGAGEILALGCGTGVEVRALARLPEVRARILGVDHSPRLVETARRLALQEGLGEQVEYRVGDAHALDLPNECFDIVVLHTLLSHVADPLQVLRETARVTRPGGSVAIFDGDYASLTFAHPDAELARTVEAAILAEVVNNPRVMRDLPHMLRTVGLRLTEAAAFAYTEIGSGSFFPNWADSFAPLLSRSGSVSPEEVERWRADLQRFTADNIFFGGSNYYTYLAQRPAG